MELINAINPLADRVAYLVSDTQYEDFRKSDYADAVYHAELSIAREYRLLERIVKYRISNEDTVILTVPIDKILTVYFNESELKRSYSDILNENEFRLIVSDGQFSIVLWQKLTGILKVHYISSGTLADNYDGSPILPAVYNNEIIRRAIIQLAQIGIGKFTGEKLNKYRNLLQVYYNRNWQPELTTSDEWIQIKPYRI